MRNSYLRGRIDTIAKKSKNRPPSSWLRVEGTRLYLSISVQAGARRNEIIGVHEDHLKIKIAAPAVEGAANQAILQYFATLLKVKKNSLSIYQGAFFKRKVVALVTDDPAGVNARLQELLPVAPPPTT